MKNYFRKAIIYRYWHISIFLLASIFFITYLVLNSILPPTEFNLKGWPQILSLAIMLSPISFLFANYQKINESKDIKGISIPERIMLRKIIDQRCKDIMYTMIIAFVISLAINGYIVIAQQDGISLRPMSFSFFLGIVFSYIITCIFWLISAFQAISELNDFKSFIQQRIDKDKKIEDFKKIINS